MIFIQLTSIWLESLCYITKLLIIILFNLLVLTQNIHYLLSYSLIFIISILLSKSLTKRITSYWSLTHLFFYAHLSSLFFVYLSLGRLLQPGLLATVFLFFLQLYTLLGNGPSSLLLGRCLRDISEMSARDWLVTGRPPHATLV